MVHESFLLLIGSCKSCDMFYPIRVHYIRVEYLRFHNIIFCDCLQGINLHLIKYSIVEAITTYKIANQDDIVYVKIIQNSPGLFIFHCNLYHCLFLLCIFLKGSVPQPRPLFHLFLVFPNKQYNFTTNQCDKMSFQYAAPGFELTTSETWVSPITTRPGLRPIEHQAYKLLN